VQEGVWGDGKGEREEDVWEGGYSGAGGGKIPRVKEGERGGDGNWEGVGLGERGGREGGASCVFPLFSRLGQALTQD